MPHDGEVGAAGKILGDGNGGVEVEDNMPPASCNAAETWFDGSEPAGNHRVPPGRGTGQPEAANALCGESGFPARPSP